jgi:purine-binding chemotaxis protein CheW
MPKFLVVEAAQWRCALPLESVVETMRPLPVQPLNDAVKAVLGLSMIRGTPVPVVNLAEVLGDTEAEHSRFVTLRAHERMFAIAVGGVIGIYEIQHQELAAVPLLNAKDGTLGLVAIHDRELVRVLKETRILPESAWQRVAAQTGANASR